MSGNDPRTEVVESADESDLYSRRDALRAGAVGVATLATLGSAGAASAAEAGELDAARLNWESDYTQVPYVPSTLMVDLVDEDMGELDYTANDGDVASLTDEGIVLARRPDEDTPHNPVTLRASDVVATDDEGEVVAFPEYVEFPRGAQYDESGDDDAETDVSVLDATHWSVDNGSTSGTLSVADDGVGLRFSIGSQADGDVATASFDLTSVASEDQAVSTGVDRRFLQAVFDVDDLPSGSTVEVRVKSSSSQTVAAKIGPSVDTSTVAGFADATGPSQVGQARLGELGTLDDITEVEVAVLDGGADVKFSGLNVERQEKWVYGTRETTDEDGNVETEDVVSPSGDFSIRSLGSIPAPFDSAAFRDVEYDAEVVASELPDERIKARLSETADSFSRPWEFDLLVEFTLPSAYSLTSVSAEGVRDEVELPSSRYLGVDVATGVSEVEEWDDVDGISWTSREERYGSVGDEVDLLASVAASDRTYVRVRTLLDDGEADTATAGSAGGGAAVASGGGSGGDGPFSWLTVAFGTVASLGVVFRKKIMGIIG